MNHSEIKATLTRRSNTLSLSDVYSWYDARGEGDAPRREPNSYRVISREQCPSYIILCCENNIAPEVLRKKVGRPVSELGPPRKVCKSFTLISFLNGIQL
jgi:hypothetical protein